jgi:phage recombination protein Bet
MEQAIEGREPAAVTVVNNAPLTAPNNVAPLTSPARRQFESEQIGAIRRTVAKDCTDAEFVMFLELCARYQLDPFARHIWAARMGGQNGAVSIIIGRDGLLAIAERHPDFRGLEGQPVYAGDDFRTQVSDAGIAVIHETAKVSERGELVGAWARVFREGRRPTYFFAPIDEYKPSGKKLEYSPWSRQLSAMILKCAESMALRKAFSVAGLVPEEETQANRVDLTAPTAEPDYGEGPEGDWLRELVAEANRLQPGSYRPARLAALMGASDFEREALTASLVEFIVERGGDVPSRPDPDVIDAEAAA